ncbi:Solitary outer membrane autotransporter beta-barrel domain [Shewanella sp. AS1]|uniref:Solitary outer membrane autotransporter beta-barrel domain n=1 Tax=Shewanella sp. AS1 TaxID=2907626 RepID=UPI001F3F169E|nr:Solitary outer membrane autotransporter beta-barrel domain [Shewanella sp. AS1]MCE9680521.1 Solitary outer membrane autotransporter beta-barrel domain [Shewanella sp. AS1]
MINRFWLISLLLLLALSSRANAIDPILRKAIKQKVTGDFTSAIVLTDANLISLGVVDFNPNAIVDLDDLGNVNAGDDDSLKRRSQLKSYTVPWESDEMDLTDDWQGAYAVRFSYVHAKDHIKGINDETISSPLEDTSYLFASEFKWKYQISDNWKVVLGAGGQLIWQDNSLIYNDPVLRQVKPLFDDALVNTSLGAIMIDPNAEFTYTSELFGHKWEYISTLRFAIGRTVMTDNGAQSVSPQVGRWSNAFLFHYELPSVWDKANEVRFLVKRVDLTGDVIQSIGTDNYYEFGAGWVIETSSLVSWLSSIGLGITININSGLSGGGIVLLLNEPL